MKQGHDLYHQEQNIIVTLNITSVSTFRGTSRFESHETGSRSLSSRAKYNCDTLSFLNQMAIRKFLYPQQVVPLSCKRKISPNSSIGSSPKLSKVKESVKSVGGDISVAKTFISKVSRCWGPLKKNSLLSMLGNLLGFNEGILLGIILGKNSSLKTIFEMSPLPGSCVDHIGSPMVISPL